MKNLTWQNPEQLFVAQELINKVKSKCCGIKDEETLLERARRIEKILQGQGRNHIALYKVIGCRNIKIRLD
ncbi:hypothetical protein NXY25_17845 [Bacteroides thetaiotaomicron]|nr:hypothetical protein [Bacteroides thetaiotaomicron]